MLKTHDLAVEAYLYQIGLVLREALGGLSWIVAPCGHRLPQNVQRTPSKPESFEILNQRIGSSMPIAE